MAEPINGDGSPQTTDEDVGYRKPPMVRRFKGSGNPPGRPKGAKNRKKVLRMIANETHTVVENGKHRRRTILELVLLALRNNALEGKNSRAFEESHRVLKAYEPQASNDNTGVLVAPADMTPDEWIDDQERTNKHRKRPTLINNPD